MLNLFKYINILRPISELKEVLVYYKSYDFYSRYYRRTLNFDILVVCYLVLSLFGELPLSYRESGRYKLILDYDPQLSPSYSTESRNTRLSELIRSR